MKINANGLYIHFPYCRHLCNYCDFYKMNINKANNDLYLKKLNENLESLDFVDWSRVKTIYLGGGTPSLWSREGAYFLKKFISQIKTMPTEITLEVDPDTWNEDEIDHWMDAGVNRFSLGVQALDDKVLSRLDRRHNLGDVEKTLKYFSDKDLNFSIDLLIGAPIKNRDILQELDRVIKYNPQHLSVYILKTRANYPLKNEEPPEEDVADEYLAVSRKLKSLGYNHYEVSNFAKLGYESLHNQAYWKLENIFAIGPNATGFYNDGNLPKRYQVSANSNKFVFDDITKEGIKIEKFYLGLRTNQGVSPKDFINEKNWEKLENTLKNWQELNAFEELNFDKIVLSSDGYLFMDSIIDDFFKYTNF